jgi:hypothetical protein
MPSSERTAARSSGTPVKRRRSMLEWITVILAEATPPASSTRRTTSATAM